MSSLLSKQDMQLPHFISHFVAGSLSQLVDPTHLASVLMQLLDSQDLHASVHPRSPLSPVPPLTQLIQRMQLDLHDMNITEVHSDVAAKGSRLLQSAVQVAPLLPVFSKRRGPETSKSWSASKMLS